MPSPAVQLMDRANKKVTTDIDVRFCDILKLLYFRRYNSLLITISINKNVDATK